MSCLFKKRNILFVCSIALLLTGCAGLFAPTPTHPQSTYILNSINPDTIHAKKTRYTLLISTPQATPGYKSSRMMYVTRDFELKSFTKNRWVDSPAQMLEPLVVQSLTNTGHFKAVLAVPYAGLTDFRLDMQVLTLQQEFLQPPSRIRLKVRAALINMTTNQIVAAKQFTVIKTTPTDDPYGGVIATNQAVATLLQQISVFVIKNV